MNTVLIVEDDTNFRKFASVNLRARGYVVTDVGDAEAALGHLQTNPPSALLLDIKLPGMSGWDLLAFIQDTPELSDRVSVVVVTASVTEVDEKTAGYGCVVDALIKPVSAQQLIAAVGKVFGEEA